jgi:glucose-6-phosphate isomerase
MRFSDSFFQEMEPHIQRAYHAMEELEKGDIANPDEKRMVGHYWLRTPHLTPDADIRQEIEWTVKSILDFASEVHQTRRFSQVLSVGIGGSALGPMFVADALGHPKRDQLRIHFVDNTDPDGIERMIARLEGQLDETLVILTSKSGGTPETHNGMVAVKHAYDRAAIHFASHAVAITMPGSRMDQLAIDQKWLMRFPMFDWVGGRTSELSAVGLLPAALQGIDIQAMLAGAAACDEATRSRDTARNPAALLALMWHYATGGRGLKDMVVLPYKDRLLLFSRYLQQLVMESLGKELDLDGKVVNQGISVYGNKGSTDQHAYVQQLRDGVHNFFVTFIRVLEEGGERIEVEKGVTPGDYLHGFLLGTREALYGKNRESLTITIRRVDARTVGALIALFERAVGFYATLVNINAYHQPGVEAGKKAAAAVLELQAKVESALTEQPRTAEQIAAKLDAETVFLVLEHLAANGRAIASGSASPAARLFRRPRQNAENSVPAADREDRR